MFVYILFGFVDITVSESVAVKYKVLSVESARAEQLLSERCHLSELAIAWGPGTLPFDTVTRATSCSPMTL